MIVFTLYVHVNDTGVVGPRLGRLLRPAARPVGVTCVSREHREGRCKFSKPRALMMSTACWTRAGEHSVCICALNAQEVVAKHSRCGSNQLMSADVSLGQRSQSVVQTWASIGSAMFHGVGQK